MCCPERDACCRFQIGFVRGYLIWWLSYDNLLPNNHRNRMQPPNFHDLNRKHAMTTGGPTRLYGWTQSYPGDSRQGAVRREWHVLCKDCNAVLDHLGSSLRASREAVVRGVAPLGKDAPLPARRAWRPTASRLAEPINITLLDHPDPEFCNNPLR